jgi:hypothetical protein
LRLFSGYRNVNTLGSSTVENSSRLRRFEGDCILLWTLNLICSPRDFEIWKVALNFRTITFWCCKIWKLRLWIWTRSGRCRYRLGGYREQVFENIDLHLAHKIMLDLWIECVSTIIEPGIPSFSFREIRSEKKRTNLILGLIQMAS